jgi:hypothetical protein
MEMEDRVVPVPSLRDGQELAPSIAIIILSLPIGSGE